MLDRCTAMSFASRENRMHKIGPSPIESDVGLTRGLKGTVFHENICTKRKIVKIMGQPTQRGDGN